MSWYHVKSLNTDTCSWGMTNKHKRKIHFNIMFESVLKRCGRFLKNLVFGKYWIAKWMDQPIVNAIIKECPNLQNIEGGCQNFRNKSDIEIIKPIFHKLKNCYCSLSTLSNNINDEDLKSLFVRNQKLERLAICSNKKTIDGSFLSALPSETIKELVFEDANYIKLHKICQVSTCFSNC